MLINFRVEYVKYAINTTNMEIVKLPFTVYVSAYDSQDAAYRAIEAEFPVTMIRVTKVIQV